MKKCYWILKRKRLFRGNEYYYGGIREVNSTSNRPELAYRFHNLTLARTVCARLNGLFSFSPFRVIRVLIDQNFDSAIPSLGDEKIDYKPESKWKGMFKRVD